MIHITDIKPDTRMQLQCGIIFTIERIELIGSSTFALCTMDKGTKEGHRIDINDSVLFFNENKSILL